MSAYIADTHIFLWALRDTSRVSDQTLAILKDHENAVFLSMASLWEIAIKSSLGKLSAPPDLAATALGNGFELLTITPEHVEQVRSLPMHHRDPFDRMLVAQALVEGATLLSVDDRLDAYGVRRL